MKRREKNDLIKRMGTALDEVLVTTAPSPEQAVNIINLLKELDAGMTMKHEDRKYHAAIRDGRIVLEREVEK